MSIAHDWHGRTLQTALQEQPALQLSFYSFGVILRKVTDNGGVIEHPVDPQAISRALSDKTCFSTGVLSDDILYVQQEGVKETIVSYRKRQRTGIWMEGMDEPLRIPLPDMILMRVTTDGKSPHYNLFAVKERPSSLDTPLFHAPLLNIYSSGNICWGSVRRGLSQGTSLAEDWESLLGTRFGNHSCHGKSRKYRQDVRKMLIELNDNQRRRVYPKRDLLPANKTLAQLLNFKEA